MVMYHGTTADFSVFDRTKGKRARFGDGFYFSPDPEKAGYHTHKGDRTLEGANIMPAFLNVRNPVITRELAHQNGRAAFRRPASGPSGAGERRRGAREAVAGALAFLCFPWQKLFGVSGGYIIGR
jgi:hypothetical protein